MPTGSWGGGTQSSEGGGTPEEAPGDKERRSAGTMRPGNCKRRVRHTVDADNVGRPNFPVSPVSKIPTDVEARTDGSSRQKARTDRSSRTDSSSRQKGLAASRQKGLAASRQYPVRVRRFVPVSYVPPYVGSQIANDWPAELEQTAPRVYVRKM